MMRRFAQVDVFTAVPLLGNPVAVVLDGNGVDDETMRRFARWTNLSETTFVLPPSNPEADYRLRIFTPAAELPFAGHPTLGSCHAWLESGQTPRGGGEIVQECAAGLIRIRQVDDGSLAFAEPPLIRSGPVDDETLDRVTGALRIERGAVVDSQWVDNGPGWVAVLLASAEEVLAVRPGTVDLDIGVVGPHPPGSATAWEIRGFFPLNGATVEDPVTGSLNASVAGWLTRTARATPPYGVSQGTAMGRAGRITIRRDEAGQLWVGGHAVTCVRGEVDLEGGSARSSASASRSS